MATKEKRRAPELEPEVLESKTETDESVSSSTQDHPDPAWPLFGLVAGSVAAVVVIGKIAERFLAVGP